MTYQIVTVCTGNICRSPMAEYALRQALEEEGLADRVEVASVGTSGWEIGNPVDSRAGALLARHGLDAGSHRARQMDAAELERADLILTLVMVAVYLFIQFYTLWQRFRLEKEM